MHLILQWFYIANELVVMPTAFQVVVYSDRGWPALALSWLRGNLWAASSLKSRVRHGAFCLPWFTCGFVLRFRFRHSLWLPFVTGFAILGELLIVPVGTMDSFLPGVSPFRLLGSLWAVPKIESSALVRLTFRVLSC